MIRVLPEATPGRGRIPATVTARTKPNMGLLKISGGKVYDPTNGINGEIRDLWIQDGTVIAAPLDPAAKGDLTLDATGMVVMPGGVDMHCHIAGPKVNAARKMRPEEKRNAPKIQRSLIQRSGTTGSVPSTYATGYLYAGLGYTTAFDAAVPPIAARHVHEEFEDTPIIDKGFYVLMGNNHYIMKQIAANEPQRVKAYIAWLLNASKGYACIVSSVVVQFPGIPRLLQWMCTGCGSSNSLAQRATSRMI